MQPGTVVGPYSIVGALGAGAMGEVYRARDRKLGRDVAIKVLPAAFTADPERLARFEREARALAALNHPHIAQIYGFEHAGDVRALVLELVEGETLADRLQRAPASRSGNPLGMPITEALGIASQIADALDAAHEKGIVHRDLKPANVKVTPASDVKVLDFGLAKTSANVAAAGEPNGSTLTFEPTVAGMVVGSVPYMSPEQARGQSVDKRTDIWALGCVLYEMLTGRRPFRGTTTTDVLAAILEREPDWSALPETTPPAIVRLLRRCLDKNPRRRLHDIADARIEIEEALAAPSGPVAAAPARSRTNGRVWAAGSLALGLLLGALAMWVLRGRSSTEASADPIRLSIPFLESRAECTRGCRHLAISEDGSLVAYRSHGQLWIRRMDQPDEVAASVSGANPFFSPDGEWIAVADDTSLRKAPIDGGRATPIVTGRISRLLGAAWGTDDTIVFANAEGIYQVAAAGGESRRLAVPDRDHGERLYAWPHFLPGGRSILFTIVPEDRGAAPRIATMNLETLERKVVLEGGSDARYVATGHLVYASGAALMAVPFDADRGYLVGEARSMPGVEIATASENGAADFAVSANGTLIFLTPASAGAGSTLQWVDRDGNREAVAIKPGYYMYPRLSPDGTRVAVEVTFPNRDIWIVDLQRLTMMQLTDDPTEDMHSVWSTDGSRVYFTSEREGNFDVYSQAADGASPARVELAADGLEFTQSITPDGTRLLLGGGRVITLGEPHPPQQLSNDIGVIDVSADGRWIVYDSPVSGSQIEIFMRPFPDVTASRTKISVDGGRYPRFSPKDDEIYYVDPDGEMMAVAIKLSPTVEVGSAKRLFTYRKPDTGSWDYDVSPVDGRFLIVQRPGAERQERIETVSVVLNWSSELTRLAPKKP